MNTARMRWWIYPVALAVLLAGWCLRMSLRSAWPLFADYWPMSATMILGSFVAGSTPAGGGSVAFPVFTKILDVSPPVARSFSLLIQSVGMTMAGLLILSRGISVSWWVIRPVIAGAVPTLLLGLSQPMPSPSYVRLAFTLVVVLFGVAVALTHWVLRFQPSPHSEHHARPRKHQAHLVLVGAAGGYTSSLFGSGADLLTFAAITLTYGFTERRAIPTTVIIMATLSLIGSAWLLVRGDPTAREAYPLWLVCVPVVAMGAPFGAWLVSRVPRIVVFRAVLGLVALEFLSTTILVGWPPDALLPLFLFLLLAGTYFVVILRHRHRIHRRESLLGVCRTWSV